MGSRGGGVGSNKGDLLAQIIEIGTTTPNGYVRAPLTRNQTSWPAASVVSGSAQSTSPQQSFSFSGGGPSPNGATLWFLAGSSATNIDNCLFGADTAATRTFANGDTERITATYRQT